MYDIKQKQTIAMRDKEVVQDYRFMPEPNLPPLLLCDQNDFKSDLINISDFEKDLKILPNQLRDDLLKLGLTLEQVFTLTNENGMTQIFLDIHNQSKSKQSNTIFTFINSDLRSILKESKLSFESCPVRPSLMAQIVDMIVLEEISLGTGQDLLRLYFQNEKRSPVLLVNELNCRLIKDREITKKIYLDTIELYPKVAKKYAKIEFENIALF